MPTRLLYVLLLMLLAPTVGRAQPLDALLDELDALFAQHVTEGRVNYAALTEAPAALDALAARFAAFDAGALRGEAQKAFWINAYNVAALHGVVHHYPIESPLDVDGFFDRETHRVGGQTLTLDALEKGELYARFADPRLHFVLVCAARGCPPLAATAYRPATLDADLDTRTRAALRLPHILTVDTDAKEIVVSELFGWYADDFGRDAALVRWLNRYRDSALPETYSIRFHPYDWRLNAR